MTFYMIFLCINLGTQDSKCYPHRDQVKFSTPELCDAASQRDDPSLVVQFLDHPMTRTGASPQAICIPVH